MPPKSKSLDLKGWGPLVLLVAVVTALALSNQQRDAPPEPSSQSGRTASRAPEWYSGSKPWHAISAEGRRKILAMRASHERTKSQAAEPSSSQANSEDAARGKLLIGEIIDAAGVDHFYKTPSMFGPRTVIWLPELAWSKLAAEDREAIRAFMRATYANWGIGTGRVQGRDVLADRLVEKR